MLFGYGFGPNSRIHIRFLGNYHAGCAIPVLIRGWRTCLYSNSIRMLAI